MVIVRQFRPAVYASLAAEAAAEGRPPPALTAGFTYELCAGILDKQDASPAQTAREEAFEECGLDVPLEAFTEVARHGRAAGRGPCGGPAGETPGPGRGGGGGRAEACERATRPSLLSYLLTRSIWRAAVAHSASPHATMA